MAEKKMTAWGTKEGYTFEFFKDDKSLCIVKVWFEGDEPIAEVVEDSFELSNRELELYMDRAKRTALMFEE